MRKKILLINPGHDNEHEIFKHKSHRLIHRDPPPIASLYIATYLYENGYKPKIIDTHIENDYLSAIKKELADNDYLYVGITVIIGKFLKNAEELTYFIRGINPDIPIVWGGIMASIFPDEVLSAYAPDYVIRYEGEETALELADALKNHGSIDKIKGLSYIKDGSIVHNEPRLPQSNLDQYPIPKWELLGKAFNKEQIPYYYLIMSSRGCPYNCSFCYKHSFDEGFKRNAPAWRYRSAEHIIKEIEYIYNKTGARVFTFGDDNFFVNKNRALEILSYFREKNFYIEEVIGHLSCIDDDVISAMGGIVQTFIFSVETASPRLQKYINKNLDLSDIPGKVKKLYEQGIVSPVSFIIGLPTEEKEDLRKNIDLMIKLKKINPFIRGNNYLFLPLPKTKLFNIVENIYNLDLPKDITLYKDANFWVKSIDDPVGKKFRPWMSDKYFKFLVLYGIVFNDIFKMCNIELSDETKKILEQDQDIKEMFEGVEFVNRPLARYRPYILDKILNNEQIDLIKGLENYVKK